MQYRSPPQRVLGQEKGLEFSASDCNWRRENLVSMSNVVVAAEVSKAKHESVQDCPADRGLGLSQAAYSYSR